MLSKSEYKAQSVLATQAGIFEAGQQTLLKNQKIKEKQENKHTVNLFLNNSKWSKTNKKAAVFKKYVKYVEEDELTFKKQIQELNDNYDILDKMCDEYLTETEELQLKLDHEKMKNNQLTKQLNRLFVLYVISLLLNVFYNVFGVDVINSCIYTLISLIFTTLFTIFKY
jgi:hypothetical protein